MQLEVGAGMRSCVEGHVVPIAHIRSVGLVEIGPAYHRVQNLHRPNPCRLAVFDREDVIHRDASDGENAVLADAFEIADAVRVAVSPRNHTQHVGTIVAGRQGLPRRLHNAWALRKCVRK
jgi:hypothetical protein